MRRLTAELISELRDLYILMQRDTTISVASFALMCEFLHKEHGLDYMSASALLERFPEMLMMTDRIRVPPKQGEPR